MEDKRTRFHSEPVNILEKPPCLAEVRKGNAGRVSLYVFRGGKPFEAGIDDVEEALINARRSSASLYEMFLICNENGENTWMRLRGAIPAGYAPIAAVIYYDRQYCVAFYS